MHYSSLLLAASVCGSDCAGFNEAFDRVLNELEILKDSQQLLKDKVLFLEERVENLEAQNLILENQVQHFEVHVSCLVLIIT